MNSKFSFFFFTILTACVLGIGMANSPADAKTSKKHTAKCQLKKHLLLNDCSKPSTNSAPEFGSHGSGGGGGESRSDIRLKHDLQLVGTTVYGLPVYDFEYNGQRGTYEGVMAQDVLKVKPEAVTTGADGFYRVNYNMLGLKLKRIR